MKKAFTSMGPALWLILSILNVSCSAQQIPEGQWLARIPYPDITYRMVLENKPSQQRLYNVTFKRHDVPMDKMIFKNDQVHFKFGEFFTKFEGNYDRTKNEITGTWITEDRVSIHVTFQQVKDDTVLGMNTRTSN